MGIRSPISTDPAMILGGLNTGVSALDMAHAYETIATGGLKVDELRRSATSTAARSGSTRSAGCKACERGERSSITRATSGSLPATVAATIHDLLLGPVSPGGTASIAEIPGVEVAGKTGTTSNYADAWFVGWTPQLTVAVWVGYPNSARPMLTNYGGQPVEGGTYPALIWRDFMEQALQILDTQSAQTSTTGSTSVAPPVTTPATVTPAPATGATTPATRPPPRRRRLRPPSRPRRRPPVHRVLR